MYFFFFQAEDGIRDVAVTGVQTCALPIFRHEHRGTAEDDLGRASLERRLADLVLLAQQVAAVQIYPVRDAAALEHPAGRIPRRLDVPAVDETHATLAGQTRGPPRPKEQARQRPGAAGPGGGGGAPPPPGPGPPPPA